MNREAIEMDKIEEILDFWFEGVTDKTETLKDDSVAKKWFKKDDAFDTLISQRFGSDLTKARKGKYDDWAKTPKGTLALILILDQFSRNVFRNSAKAFDTDFKALEFTLVAMKKGQDEKLNFYQRQFLYMPMMHSEDAYIQEKSVEVYEQLLKDAVGSNPALEGYFKNVLDFALKHKQIIDQFKRFPHRNTVLNRNSTPAEVQFLEQADSSF